jgi:hypothetical protein
MFMSPVTAACGEDKNRPFGRRHGRVTLLSLVRMGIEGDRRRYGPGTVIGLSMPLPETIGVPGVCASSPRDAAVTRSPCAVDGWVTSAF